MFFWLLRQCSGCWSSEDIRASIRSRSRKIGCCNDRIALTFDGYLGSAAIEVQISERLESLNGFETLRYPLWYGAISSHVIDVVHLEYAYLSTASITYFIAFCILYFQHIEAETRWLPFRRRYFQVHFLE